MIHRLDRLLSSCVLSPCSPCGSPCSPGDPDVDDVEEAKAGTYMLKVEDKSSMHDFDLIGPGVDEEVTGLVRVGTRSSVTVIAFLPTKSTPHAAPCSRTPMA
jgi:hypothetical protein